VAAANSQRARWYILGNAGTRSDVSAFADAQGSNQGGIGAYKDVVADGGPMLEHTVVVAGDRTRTHVYTGADVGVTEVVKVVGLGAAAEAEVLGLHEVPYMSVFADVAAGTKVSVGTEEGIAADCGLIEDAAVADKNAIADGGVLDDGVGPNPAVVADAGVAEELDEGLYGGISADFDGGVDDTGLGSEDRHALRHEFASGCEAHRSVEVHHLSDGVSSEDLVDVLSLDRDDSLAFGDEKGSNVGEIELSAGVLVGEAIEVGKKCFGLEAIDSGVDLRSRKLIGLKIFLLNDGCDFGRTFALAEDAAVAGGVGWNCGEDGHRCVLLQVEGAEGLQGLRADERHVAGEDQQVFGWDLPGEGEVLLEHLERMARAALFALHDEVDAGGDSDGAYVIGMVADDAVDAVGRRDGLGSGDDMQDERSPADLVEDLWALGFQPGTLAGGHDCDAKCGGVHTLLIFSRGSGKAGTDGHRPR